MCYSEEEKAALSRQKKGKKRSLFFSLKKKEEITFIRAFKEEEETLIHHQSAIKRHHKSTSSSSATACTMGVRTRAQMRRVRERDLWDVIVNNDDITFTHILPRLNGTDIKFLHEVNYETRALVKRSSRAGDLKRSLI